MQEVENNSSGEKKMGPWLPVPRKESSDQRGEEDCRGSRKRGWGKREREFSNGLRLVHGAAEAMGRYPCGGTSKPKRGAVVHWVAKRRKEAGRRLDGRGPSGRGKQRKREARRYADGCRG